ncbi:MAG: hypothetical protein R3Y36_05050, partial [Spirochaetales bacterium]
EEQSNAESDNLAKIFNAKVGAVEEKIEQSVTDLQNKLQDAENRLHAEHNQLLQSMPGIITQQEQQIHEKLNDYHQHLEISVKQLSENLDREIAALAEKTADKIARQSNSLIEFEQTFEQTKRTAEAVAETAQRIDDTMSQKHDENKELLERLQDYFNSRSDELIKNVDEKINKAENDFDGTVSHLQKAVTDKTEHIFENVNIRCNEITDTFDSRFLEIENILTSVRAEALKHNDAKTTEFFEELEKSMQNSKNDMEYRFQRLNSVGQDVENLETNFRRLMDVSEKRVLADFDTFKNNRTAAQNEFEQETVSSFNVMKERLENLDNELNDLKTRAYDNVSEKLQLFEDDFFADLNKRGEDLTSSLIDWKQQFDSRLVEIANNLEDNRLALELKFSEEMKEHLAVTQEKHREQIMRIDENVKNTENNFITRIGNIETTLHTFIDTQRMEIDRAKQAAEEYLKAAIENQGEATTEELKRYEREISTQLNQLSQTVSATQGETTNSLESVLTDFTSWQERLNTQFQENRASYTDKFEALQTAVNDKIAQVEQIFASELGNYTNLAQEEKQRLSAEVEELKTQSQKSLDSYEVRSGEILEEFKKSYETMLEDTQRRMRLENSDTEQKLRALKSMVQEVRQEHEDAQEKVVLKIQTEANLLTMNMDDIDKKLKQFVAQTNLFEKTDEMKNELENYMVGLRTQMTRFENFKQTTDSIESQFEKIRKLDDDSLARIQRFSLEKNRIDALEADFNKLLHLSASMDQKIIELKNTGDDLQILQVEVRRFQETLGDISGRYDRLEKKAPVLEQTMSDIDTAFENLRELEDRLVSCSDQTMEIPDEVNTLKADLSNLMENSKNIGDVMDKLNNLDTLLEQTTQKAESVEKARDWIVRTETRLSEMTKEATEQVNLFGALMKKGGPNKNDAGAPPIAVRENVIKLAHQGWKKEQIAASLNLTIGEVELILDFYGNDGR